MVEFLAPEQRLKKNWRPKSHGDDHHDFNYCPIECSIRPGILKHFKHFNGSPSFSDTPGLEVSGLELAATVVL